MKCRAIVWIEFDVDPELVDCPVNGAEAIAAKYSGMALAYASIGASESGVLLVEKDVDSRLNFIDNTNID